MKTYKYWLKGTEHDKWVEVVFSIDDDGDIIFPLDAKIADYRVYEGDSLVEHYPMQAGFGVSIEDSKTL